MRLLAATGRGEDALRQFDTIMRVAEGEGEEIPAQARALAEELRRRPRSQRSRPPARRETPPAEASADHAAGPAEPAAESSERRPLAPPRPPVPLAPFFGREAETTQILALLRDRPPDGGARLVTLTGPGGLGKTRLALHVARQWDETYGGGEKTRSTSSPVCVFVPLVDVSDPDALPRAVADALRLERDPGRTPTEQIVEVLSRRPLSLLVLDNFETLLGGEDEGDEPTAGAALWVVTLLQSLPLLACLVTSRQRLLVDDEQESPVPPLPVPPPHPEGPGPAGLLAVPSVALFVDRAQRARPDFQITARNARAVAELCARLEGIPLAIEIAATWANTLSVSAMLARLDEVGRFSLLTSRRRDLPPRHRTLRAAVEGTVRALPPDLQAFFARLSVFRGGFSAETSAAVCAAPLGWVEDALAHLREHSLIVPAACPASHSDPDEAPLRFTLLETLREFGAEYLEATLGAGEAAALARRHAEHYAAFAEKARPELRGPDQATWFDRLQREQENLRAALAWAIEHEPERALRLGRDLCQFWIVRGSRWEGRSWLERALARDDGAPSPVRAAALNAAGRLAYSLGDPVAARLLYQESLTIYREQGDLRSVASVLGNLGLVIYEQGDFASARPLLEESLEIGRGQGYEALVASALGNLGLLVWRQGDYEAARTLFAEQLEMRRAAGDDMSAAIALGNLAGVAREQQKLAEARSWLEESLTLSRRIGDTEGVAYALGAMGGLDGDLGEYDSARALLEEALALRREQGSRREIAVALMKLGEVMGSQGDLRGARALHEESLTLFRAMEEKNFIGYVLLNLGNLVVQEGAFAAALPLITEAGMLFRISGDRLGISECLNGYAACAAENGLRPEGAPHAARLLGARMALRGMLGVPLLLKEQRDYDAYRATLVELMGDEAFMAAWEAGFQTSWEENVAYALGEGNA